MVNRVYKLLHYMVRLRHYGKSAMIVRRGKSAHQSHHERSSIFHSEAAGDDQRTLYLRITKDITKHIAYR